MINLMCLYMILHQDSLSKPLFIPFVILPFLTSPFLAIARDNTHRRLIYTDDENEIEAMQAETCPIDSDIFKFELIKS